MIIVYFVVILLLVVVILKELRLIKPRSWESDDDVMKDLEKHVNNKILAKNFTSKATIFSSALFNPSMFITKTAWIITETDLYFLERYRVYEGFITLPLKEETFRDFEKWKIDQLGGSGRINLTIQFGGNCVLEFFDKKILGNNSCLSAFKYVKERAESVANKH